MLLLARPNLEIFCIVTGMRFYVGLLILASFMFGPSASAKTYVLGPGDDFGKFHIGFEDVIQVNLPVNTQPTNWRIIQMPSELEKVREASSRVSVGTVMQTFDFKLRLHQLMKGCQLVELGLFRFQKFYHPLNRFRFYVCQSDGLTPIL